MGLSSKGIRWRKRKTSKNEAKYKFSGSVLIVFEALSKNCHMPATLPCIV